METLNTVMIMAQGGNVDSSGLEDWIRQWGDSLQTWLSVIIGIAGLLFSGILVIKGLNELGKKRANDAVKMFVFAALVVLMAIIGIGGIYAIIETIKPVDGNGVTDYLQ